MHIALKFGYDGWLFEGYANQNIRDPPRTVEGEVLKALGRLAGKKGNAESVRKALAFGSSSRTDKGVCAIGNVMAFKLDMDPVTAIHALNGMVDGCFFWAYVSVPDDFQPRHASARHYRYILEDTYSNAGFKRMIEAGAEFLGEHDFKAFSTKDRSEPDKGTVRDISDIRLHRAGDMIQMDLFSRSFLWHQIRKMVWALDQVGRGKMGRTVIKDLLAGETARTEIGLAPPEHLILMDVSYGGLKFKTVPKLRLETLSERKATLEGEIAFIELASRTTIHGKNI
jgi:tRNA pseudouridine38-40 synthase